MRIYLTGGRLLLNQPPQYELPQDPVEPYAPRLVRPGSAFFLADQVDEYNPETKHGVVVVVAQDGEYAFHGAKLFRNEEPLGLSVTYEA